MRLGSLILWDMRFQAKYGFYFLYAVMTLIYLVVLFAFPKEVRENAAAIMIFSDPAAMGLFFMGAIVLLEKSQNTPFAIAVSPVSVTEYIFAKVASLSVISLIVAAILALAARAENLHFVLLGTAVASVIFSLFGVIIAAKIVSLNQFILWTAPIEILGLVPALLHPFHIAPAWFRHYPANICMDMILGRAPSVIGIFMLTGLITVLFILARRCVLKMWRSTGGVKA